MLNRHYKCKNI